MRRWQQADGTGKRTYPDSIMGSMTVIRLTQAIVHCCMEEPLADWLNAKKTFPSASGRANSRADQAPIRQTQNVRDYIASVCICRSCVIVMRPIIFENDASHQRTTVSP